ncbi:uroporphyrinogen-III C-methyltransferase [Xenorhabdus nematophila]|uniref:siroheme synthase CysG n=1 Tax=Xenorhabdus nematophila TaxID=628 RepID=UPI00054215BB|nr:siroheme synthase CysG [Xenorhabdus nematophila]CEF28843.1 multifunctional siroheme synthase: uroporphyrinogen methyltransferase; 1,3-dimethyluroporphyriongen III dehydrogenase; siroheme ferrochelatase [Xenorhabdus nematophila str. Websteri]AYA42273.1 uroporphyrinogen-III C-methyltransferase [Xenorhabdus nematophila]KHD28897.1 sirohydrochlorin ferrochelatase [Xenorhabdus nematophila]MBA0020999.1 uroporphyrinogen-III C-methyltransferase [Xenorhabdus nematophila]MCB4425955.1 uroporphyrinogen-
MDYLPLFVDLKARPVLLAGGGEIASRKASLLLSAGAALTIVAPELHAELQQRHQKGEFEWLQGTFKTDYLDGIFLVVAATDDHQLNQHIFTKADHRAILANVVDNQPLCSAIFPSIIDRSPVMVAISSAGRSPVLTKLLREKLESLLPFHLGTMAKIAGNWRERVKQRFLSLRQRRHFWEKAFHGRFATLVANGQLQQAEEQLEQQLEQTQARAQGELALVGAGPGDPGLLTLKGLQVIQQADVVLYDHLVSTEILELVRRDADKICVGKRAGNHSVLQEETNALIIKLAHQGKKVVRLKGGDPFIFGRGGEELQIAAEAGIPFQVVPGITAAVGASAYAGIPLTHREHSQSVTFITGHCRENGHELDWPALARGNQTLAIYMGTVKAALISQNLISHGRDPNTPVAVIGCGTRPEQQVLTGILSELERLAQEAPSPALIVVGEVAQLHHQIAWFGQQSIDQNVIDQEKAGAQVSRPAVIDLV